MLYIIIVSIQYTTEVMIQFWIIFNSLVVKWLKRHSIQSIVKFYYYYGIHGKTLQWFESYLTNRSQYVLFNGGKSDIRDITYGVLQGFILGLLLFILYINDFSGISVKLYSQMTSIFF